MSRVLVGFTAGIAACVLLLPAVALATFGIDPGKVYIDNLHPGAEADVPITLYNQNDYATTFLISARNPDYTDTGYEPFPYLEWISIEPEQVTLDANETSKVLVVIIMPEDAQYSGKKAEVWISFTEEPRPGEMIQIEIASRLFISTRVEKVTTTSQAPPSPPPTTGPAIPPQPPQTTIVPTTEEGGQVGISAGGQGDEGDAGQFPWIVVGPLLGVAVVLGTVILFLWIRHRT